LSSLDIFAENPYKILKFDTLLSEKFEVETIYIYSYQWIIFNQLVLKL